MNLPGELEVSILREIGIEERELMADPEMVPKEFRRALPETARMFAQGDIPQHGFGIVGVAGSGKTCAMVSLLKLHLRAAYKKRREAEVAPEDPRSLRRTYLWIDWPRTAHLLRSYAVSNPAFVHDLIESMCKAQVLILDDLGAERLKGSYQEDYAIGELDYIVSSSRYRSCKPTWYTSNLRSLEKITEFYGSRFASRLVGDSPMVELVGTDRRLSS